MTSSLHAMRTRSASKTGVCGVLPLLCRYGAPLPVAVAYTLAVVVTATGCHFTDFSKTQPVYTPDAGPVTEPACLEPSDVTDAGVATAEMVAHFTFNNGLSNGQWLDEQQAHALVPAVDPSGAGVALAAVIPRINGVGQSLSLNGHQFARSLASDDLFPPQFTVAAWISVPPAVALEDSSFTWPIISTLTSDSRCDGYQLDIRARKDTGSSLVHLELVLSHQMQDDSDAGAQRCVVRALHAPLDIPSWATGNGRWHHVAGSLSQGANRLAQFALFWDGKLIQVHDPLDPPPATDVSVLADDRTLYVGTNATDATSAASTKFTGYIDDIAIFKHALTEQELNDFMLATTTHPGPSNCRWRASEQWDNTAITPTYAQWSSESTPQALSIEIEDYDWGVGALDARLDPPRDIQLYGKAYLEGYFPAGKGFQFTLASGDNYCTWTRLGHGSGRYEFDLRNPVSCVSNTCEVDLHRVTRASVTSEWAIPSGAEAAAAGDKQRLPGPVQFVVRSLDFEPVEGALPDWSGYGGVYGPLGYCWRLQAYEPETSAFWTQGERPWTELLSATLRGPSISGPRIMADFGAPGHDIYTCTGATLEAQLEPAGPNPYVLAIQDINGSWISYDLLRESSPGSGVYNVTFSTAAHSASADDPNFDRFPSLDLHRVRFVGVQKPWLYDGSLNVTIKKFTFTPEGCEQPAPG